MDQQGSFCGKDGAVVELQIENRHRFFGQREGVAVIAGVMVLAAVTILIGLGRLVAYRNQVRIRLDREREIQQMLATRSAVRWLEANATQLWLLPISNRFETVRGPMGVSIHPAEALFPRKDNDLHCDYGAKTGKKSYVHESCGFQYDEGRKGWLFTDENTTTGSVRWAYLDLSTNVLKDALWTSDPFGRRYLLNVNNTCKASPTEDGNEQTLGDIISFGITPYGCSLFSEQGSPCTNYAIWVEQQVVIPDAIQESAKLSLWARVPGHGVRSLWNLSDGEGFVQAAVPLGIQIAGSYAMAAKQVNYEGDGDAEFWSTTTYPEDQTEKLAFLEKFAAECESCGGIRLTVQVSAIRSRPESCSETDATMFRTVLGTISVTPAYEFFTVLDWLEQDALGQIRFTNEVSTVVGYRKDPSNRKSGIATTYDTHGTYMNRKHQARGGEQ